MLRALRGALSFAVTASPPLARVRSAHSTVSVEISSLLLTPSTLARSLSISRAAPEPHRSAEAPSSMASDGAAAAAGGGGSYPAAGVVPEGYTVVSEGKGKIIGVKDSNEVFYNPAQVVNRDLSILNLKLFQELRKEEAANGTLKRNRVRKGTVHPAVKQYPELADRLGLVPPEPVEPTEEAAAAAAAEPTDGEEAAEAPKAKEPVVAAPLRILEGLAASGLRAMRYVQEIPDVGTVVANDNDPVAVEAIRRNLAFNGAVTANVFPVESDARLLMLQMEKAFDVVDLDPYGTPAMFLDSAVQTCVDGGLMAVTATDMAVLCGNNKEVCWMKYGSFPLRAKYCHEMALRILLANIESHANRYKRHIVPLLSVSVDFYVRVFVRIYTSPSACKNSPTKLSHVYQVGAMRTTYGCASFAPMRRDTTIRHASRNIRLQASYKVLKECVGCESFHLQPLARTAPTNDGNATRYMPGKAPCVSPKCEECGWDFNMGGPFWTEPLHDPVWTKKLLSKLEQEKALFSAYGKVHALLTTVNEELLDVPLFMTLHAMSHTLKCTPPPANLFRSALINAGYRASTAHCNPLALKTDAPMSVLWDIMRCWVQEHPVKPSKEKTPATAILAKEPKLKANFSRVAGAMIKSQQAGIVRFPLNPEENWGPKARAGTVLKRPAPDDNSEGNEPATKAAKEGE